jgi:hypothetical protein
MTCKECVHYGFYELLVNGRPIGYGGNIPCLTCSRYKTTQDNFRPLAVEGTSCEEPNSLFTEILSAQSVNVLAKKEGSVWIGHCLELDIVATANSIEELKSDLDKLIIAQIDYAFSNDNLDFLYHPAPPDVWKEFFSCKDQVEDRIQQTTL